MRRNVKKAAAFLLAFALIFSMAGSGRVIVSAQQSTETAETLETAKTQETPSVQNSMPSTDESMENSQNTSQDSVESPSEPEGGTADTDMEKDENGTDSKDPSNPMTPSTAPSEEEPSSEVSSSEEPSTEESSTEASSTEESSSEVSSTPETDEEEETPVETETETETGTDEDSQTVSGNDVPEESASEGSVSGNSVSGNGIALMSVKNSFSRSIKVGETITLGSNSKWIKDHEWSCNNNSIVKTSENSDSGTLSVTGLAEGTAIISHDYTLRIGGSQRDVYTIRVTNGGDNDTYNLYIYTLIPGVAESSSADANDVWNGMSIGSISNVKDPEQEAGDKVIYLGDATIRNLDNIDLKEDDFPLIQNPSDGEWYTYARADEEKNKEGYYTIQWLRIKVADGANEGHNKQFGDTAPVPSGTNTYHLDGILILNEKDRCIVNFALKDVGETDFTILDDYSERVESGYLASQLKRPEMNEQDKYPQTKSVDGIQYVFDGWYRDQNCTQKVDWESETVIDNPTTYYARYIPSAQTITVTKDVTGGLGDVQKAFAFSYSYMDASEKLQSGTFELKDGESEKILNIPVGAELTLTEKNAGGYSVSATYGNKTIDASEGESSDEKTLKITIDKDYIEIKVINNKEVTPDTGILLDSTPHILSLILITGCAVAFIIGRRKKHFS